MMFASSLKVFEDWVEMYGSWPLKWNRWNGQGLTLSLIDGAIIVVVSRPIDWTRVYIVSDRWSRDERIEPWNGQGLTLLLIDGID